MKKKSKRQRSQAKGLRWSLALAGTEYGLSPKTVATRVAAAGILPGEDGLFSTADVHRAICGDYERERTRKMREDADQVALNNAQARGQLVDRDDFVKSYEKVYGELRQLVMGAKLADSDKDALLNKLAELHFT